MSKVVRCTFNPIGCSSIQIAEKKFLTAKCDFPAWKYAEFAFKKMDAHDISLVKFRVVPSLSLNMSPFRKQFEMRCSKVSGNEDCSYHCWQFDTLWTEQILAQVQLLCLTDIFFWVNFLSIHPSYVERSFILGQQVVSFHVKNLRFP